MEAIADPPAYHRARAAVRFDDISRALVHALKYGDRLDLAPMMGRWLAHAGRELLAEADALVPVPLHWRRLWARRFNQSAMLAAAVSEASGVPVAAARAQARQGDRRSRSGCRAPSAPPMSKAPSACPTDGKAEVAGRRLVLVDDVLTSGATVEGCARALLRAGAAERRRAGVRQGCRAQAEHPYKELIN